MLRDERTIEPVDVHVSVAAAAADTPVAGAVTPGHCVLCRVEKYRPATLDDLIAHTDIVSTGAASARMPRRPTQPPGLSASARA